MRKRLIVTSLIVIVMQSPTHVNAGAFATELTQALNHGQLVMSYIRQGEQLANEIQMYQNMLRNVKQLPGQTYGPIAADLNNLANIVQGGQALAYSLSNLDALFRTTYPGYSTSPTAYYRQYQQWSQTSLDTTLGVLRAAGLQGQQLQSEQNVLNSLRGMAQTSDGQMQALQVMGEVNEQQVQQLMKLRQLMIADMTSKQAYQATMIQQNVSQEAASEWFFKGGGVSGDGKQYLPGLQ